MHAGISERPAFKTRNTEELVFFVSCLRGIYDSKWPLIWKSSFSSDQGDNHTFLLGKHVSRVGSILPIYLFRLLALIQAKQFCFVVLIKSVWSWITMKFLERMRNNTRPSVCWDTGCFCKFSLSRFCKCVLKLFNIMPTHKSHIISLLFPLWR